jgi:hypothetical protein
VSESTLINEMQAHQIATGIADPIVRNLVAFAIAEARMTATRRVGQEEAEWQQRLPEQPFDMVFFTNVLSSMFGKTDIVRNVLNGQDLAEASDWDV